MTSKQNFKTKTENLIIYKIIIQRVVANKRKSEPQNSESEENSGTEENSDEEKKKPKKKAKVEPKAKPGKKVVSKSHSDSEFINRSE